MKEFILTKNQNFTFGNCQNCTALCCKGISGTLYSQIILEEFEKVYKYFPILFTFGELGYTKPVVLLTDGVNSCRYLKNNACTIYENRPTVCRTYPLSPNLDNEIYIDINCPEVNKHQKYIVKNNTIEKDFDNSVFYDYQDKYLQTHYEFENLKKEDFKKIISIKNIDFFEYCGEESSSYLSYHKQSILTHLK